MAGKETLKAKLLPSELSFKVVCDFFDAVQKSRGKRKALMIRSLLDRTLQRKSEWWNTLENEELYQVFRLILPYRDNKRGNYELKETKLASTLCKACSLNPKVNSSAQHAVEWKKPSTVNAGNFAAVMEEYLFKPNCGKSAESKGEAMLKVGQVNKKLDDLVAAKGDEKVKILQWFIQNTSPRLMKRLVSIILKDLKIGISEATIFKEYHQDAESVFNISMNLEKVIVELKDPKYRPPKKDVEPGLPVRSQLAAPALSVKAAFDKMKGDPFVVETKFDGERMQVHRTVDKVHYFSRRAIDHGEQSGYSIFDPVLNAQIAEQTFIMDCEMIAWNKQKQGFEPFGGLKSAFRAANDGVAASSAIKFDSGFESSSSQSGMEALAGDLEIVCVAFDLLYYKDQSVIHLPLTERQKLLSELISDTTAAGVQLGRSCLRGRLFPLMPSRKFIDDAQCSQQGYNQSDIKDALETAITLQEEGIVVKSLSAPWRANDRSGAWVKIKPDYVHHAEIDAVVIGAHYGTGRRAGDIAEYLLALADSPRPGQDKPDHFISFCRVGTGLSDEERRKVADHLRPQFLDADAKMPNAPKCYTITGASKERPDVWIKDPFQSVVLQVTADVRTIQSSTFAAHQSLRFPRIQEIRWDKDTADVQTQQDLDALTDGQRTGEAGDKKQKRRQKASTRKKAGEPGLASSQYQAVDVSKVQRRSNLLKGMKIHILSYGEGDLNKENVAKLVAERGGQVYASLAQGVTHVLASKPKKWQLTTCTRSGRSVIELDWLLEVASSGKFVKPRPHHLIFLSIPDRHKDADRDGLGDLYNVLSTAEDIAALVERPAEGTSPAKARRHKGVTALFLREKLAVERQLDEGSCVMPDTALQGCRFSILYHPSADIDPLHALRQGYWSALIRLCGGTVLQSVTPRTTHVLLGPAFLGMTASDLLQSPVLNKAALQSLRQAAESCSLTFVSESWVQEVFNAVKSESLPQSQADLLATSDPTVPAVQNLRKEDWLWEEHGIGLPKPGRKKKEKTKPKAAAKQSKPSAVKKTEAKAAPTVRSRQRAGTRKGARPAKAKIPCSSSPVKRKRKTVIEESDEEDVPAEAAAAKRDVAPSTYQAEAGTKRDDCSVGDSKRQKTADTQEVQSESNALLDALMADSDGDDAPNVQSGHAPADDLKLEVKEENPPGQRTGTTASTATAVRSPSAPATRKKRNLRDRMKTGAP